MRALRPVLAALLCAALIPTTARNAEACGGFFCNNTAPVVQAGERIVFALESGPDGSRVIAHVQIQYSGPAESFAWILPVPELVADPRVGTDALFTMLDQQVAPQFQTTIEEIGECDDVLFDSAGGANNGGNGQAPTDGEGGGGVNVQFRGEVGPFDAAVIEATSVEDLTTWLDGEGYQFPTSTTMLLGPYVEKGDSFVALKLLKDRDAGDVRPIVLELRGDEACIPIKLTQVAAQNDMGIIAHVLGEARAVPVNYRHVEINQARIDWIGGGFNYGDVVTEASNEAGGQAFATDYAGTTAVMQNQIWNADRNGSFAALRSQASLRIVLETLQNIGVLGDPATQEALRAEVTWDDGEPADLTTLFTCPFCFDEGDYAGAVFDPTSLHAEIDQKVVTPLREANALFEDYGYLTRLYTTMSPEEMTEDPIFRMNPMLPPQDNVRRATLQLLCGNGDHDRFSAPVRLVLEDGTVIDNIGTLNNGNTSLDTGSPLGDTPAAARVEQLDETSPMADVIEDRGDAISQAIKAHNASVESGGGGSDGCHTAGRTPALLAFAGLLLLLRRRR